jgi:hypothetical protein
MAIFISHGHQDVKGGRGEREKRFRNGTKVRHEVDPQYTHYGYIVNGYIHDLSTPKIVISADNKIFSKFSDFVSVTYRESGRAFARCDFNFERERGRYMHVPVIVDSLIWVVRAIFGF